MKELLNKIHHADCLEFMKGLPDKSIDLVLTDPPYGIHEKLLTTSATQNKSNKFALMYQEKNWDKLPDKEIFTEIFRISKNQIIWGGNYFSEYLYSSRGWFIWDKEGDNLTVVNNELAWTSYDIAIKMLRRCHGLDKGFMNSEGKNIHPTQKPLPLFKWCLQQSKLEKGIILDCFSGSGTTALACHDLGLDFICIEKDADYHKASVERLEQHKRQLKLL